jgi:hypothetical protein
MSLRWTVALIAAALLAAGCGSVAAVEELPPAAGPDRSPPLAASPAGRVVPGGIPDGLAVAPPALLDGGRLVARVDRRARRLELFEVATGAHVVGAPAGAGPTSVVSNGKRRLYVVDTAGDGLLVFELRGGELVLTRRAYVPGAPYALAADHTRGRLWVASTAQNRVRELSAGPRPRFLRAFATVRQPDALAVDQRSGRVYVAGRAGGVVQVIDPPPLPRRAT